MHAVVEKLLKEGLRNIAFIAEEFAKEVFDQCGYDGAIIFGGLTEAETAEILGLSVTTVKRD